MSVLTDQMKGKLEDLCRRTVMEADPAAQDRLERMLADFMARASKTHDGLTRLSPDQMGEILVRFYQQGFKDGSEIAIKTAAAAFEMIGEESERP